MHHFYSLAPSSLDVTALFYGGIMAFTQELPRSLSPSRLSFLASTLRPPGKTEPGLLDGRAHHFDAVSDRAHPHQHLPPSRAHVTIGRRLNRDANAAWLNTLWQMQLALKLYFGHGDSASQSVAGNRDGRAAQPRRPTGTEGAGAGGPRHPCPAHTEDQRHQRDRVPAQRRAVDRGQDHHRSRWPLRLRLRHLHATRRAGEAGRGAVS